MTALSADQQGELGRLLERERNRLVRRLKRFAESRDEVEVGGFSQHMAEDASALTERETAFLLASEEGRRLLAVNQALDRLTRTPATVGVCAGCGAAIAWERLEAIPYTELCIGCKCADEESRSGRSA